jgi:multidrug efflux pump subunit AcrB
MWLIRAAMRRPITILIVIAGIASASLLAFQRMRADIFPNLGTPVIYVAQTYGGMDPAQMEGYLVNYYEYHFLYITGIDHVESRAIQGVALLKLFFHEGTDMGQALAETVAQVNRSRAFMPYGTHPPFIMRFDAGSLPVGYLVFSSDSRSLGEIQNLALFQVRPMFATLPGVSAPPPFGGNQRTLVVNVDPDRLRAYRMSPEEVVQAIARGNTIMPSGTVRVGDVARMTPINSVVRDPHELNDLPIRLGAGPTVYLRDVGFARDGTDVVSGFALVNGRRAVYIPVTKRADASTLAVVTQVKAALGRMQAVVPSDIKVSFEFDQSGYVKNAIRTLGTEGLLGALLTGLMVLIFLRSFRSALIVVLTIPLALLAAVVALWAAGQTINIMTLGGLTLAIGVLVDESTVAIENIHTHLARKKSVARAVLDASVEVVTPRLLAMLCVVAVFFPSFFMAGVGRALFVPLSLAVGFAMVASYFLASSFVPILAAWLSKPEHRSEGRFSFTGVQAGYVRLSRLLVRLRWPVIGVYVAASLAIIYFVGGRLGTEIFPTVDTGQIQLRVRAQAGTRVERTEIIAQRALQTIEEDVGADKIAASLGFVGLQASSYPINTIYLWTSGPHEAFLLVALKPDSGISTAALQERLRRKLPSIAPGLTVSFEAADLVSQVMSFGAPTPIEVAIAGTNLSASRTYGEKVMSELKRIPALRDLQIGQLLEYPTLDVNVDRERAAQLGLTVRDVGRALVAATSSTRFTEPNYWADPATGIAYQVQVEMPQSRIASAEDIAKVPVTLNGESRPLIGDVATLREGRAVGEYHRYNMQRMVTISANVVGQDLKGAGDAVRAAVARAGEPPRGTTFAVRGQLAPLEQVIDNLEFGLILAIMAVLLLLAAYFQSLRVALVVIATIPAVIAGVVLILFLTGTTLNLQSYMGAIMAIGVAVANSILLATFADQHRRAGSPADIAAVEAARTRFRPILMTTTAMIAGMIPLALGTEQTAPLGRAVIGGLAAATLTTLGVLPSIFALVEKRSATRSPSIDPDDPESIHFAPREETL